jgi:hypothetical protein
MYKRASRWLMKVHDWKWLTSASRSSYLLSHSRIPPSFIAAGSVPCTQERASCAILSQINSIHALWSYFFKSCFNISPSPTYATAFSSISFSQVLKHSPSSHLYHMPHPSHSPLLCHCNGDWQVIHIFMRSG